MALNFINIEGAYQHNLKGISLKLPRNKFIVITGVSGSGKSSLAFDTLYAEGHRRYVESLSSYARQFMDQLEKPDVDLIEGLSPAISIEQRTASSTPRSTVGTATEIYDFLRLLYAKIGTLHCPDCGLPVKAQSTEDIIKEIMKLKEGTRLHILAPIVRGRKGRYTREINDIREKGFVRARIDGEMTDIDTPLDLDKNKYHDIEIVVDSIIIKPEIGNRLLASVETAFKLADNNVVINVIGQEDRVFSSSFSCPQCRRGFNEINPRDFSFNSPKGYCPACKGLGSRMEIDVNLIIPDESISILKGAIRSWGKNLKNSEFIRKLEKISLEFHYDLSSPYSEMPLEMKNLIVFGDTDLQVSRKGRNNKPRKSVFPGIVPQMEERYLSTNSSSVRERIESFMTNHICSVCLGKRLNRTSLSVLTCGQDISEMARMNMEALSCNLRNIKLRGRDANIGESIVKEIIDRLDFLLNVGLGYLTLDRRSSTLSGGEAQRIRLATQVGSKLKGILYVLDEPSIGLHRRDNLKLLETIKKMKDLGNTVIVVEHDEEAIKGADHIVDFGPGAGTEGGEIVAEGTLREIMRSKRSVTGQYLAGKEVIPLPIERKNPNGKKLVISGINENNLKNINLSLPLGLITVITGVSGSGKSTLINDVALKAVSSELLGLPVPQRKFESISGTELLNGVIMVDQSSIGRSSRSNPATYTGVWGPVRDLYSKLPLSRMRGYSKSRFSFNVKSGRCPKCEGMGEIRVEMRMLPDLYVKCDICNGKRFDRETLEVAYKGHTIESVLNMTVSEAFDVFSSIPEINKKLSVLIEIGLGYLKLGQSSTTLSGGEAQRLKLSRELSRKNGRILYLLDEPTIGLHFHDIKILLETLKRLRDRDNTIVVIEHNYDVIKSADWIIDLGPEGGDSGGEIVAEGTPEQVAEEKDSFTGRYLKEILTR